MKFCHECGCKLNGYEKFCPECGIEFKRPQDTEYFVESIVNQFLDDMDQLKNDAIEFVNEMEIDEVIDDFSRNSKKALNRDAVYIRRARRKLEESGDNERVIYLCNKALLIDDKNWEAYYLKGRALINLKRYGEAINELLNSLALNEDNLKARLCIGKAYQFKGDLDYALKVYDSILNINDKYFEALLAKADIYFDLKEYSKADECFKKASIISPISADVRVKWDFCREKIKN